LTIHVALEVGFACVAVVVLGFAENATFPEFLEEPVFGVEIFGVVVLAFLGECIRLPLAAA